MIMSLFFIGLVGFFICLYSIFLEEKIKKDPTYKPICDISDRISCSKPFLSQYGKLVLVSNSILGLIFYLFVVILALFSQTTIIFYASLAAISASIGFAYILYVKVKSFCLICHVIYAINIALLLVSYAYL